MIFIYYNNYLNNNIIKKINNTIINIQYIYIITTLLRRGDVQNASLQ